MGGPCSGSGTSDLAGGWDCSLHPRPVRQSAELGYVRRDLCDCRCVGRKIRMGRDLARLRRDHASAYGRLHSFLLRSAGRNEKTAFGLGWSRVPVALRDFIPAALRGLSPGISLSWLSLHPELAVVRMARHRWAHPTLMVACAVGASEAIAQPGSDQPGACRLRLGLLCRSLDSVATGALWKPGPLAAVAQPASALRSVHFVCWRISRSMCAKEPTVAMASAISSFVLGYVPRPTHTFRG